jgi:hypothetical protein
MISTWLEKPESNEFNGKRIACIVNPEDPKGPVTFQNKMGIALKKEYCVGVIYLQFGKYTLLGPSVESMR